MELEELKLGLEKYDSRKDRISDITLSHIIGSSPLVELKIRLVPHGSADQTGGIKVGSDANYAFAAVLMSDGQQVARMDNSHPIPFSGVPYSGVHSHDLIGSRPSVPVPHVQVFKDIYPTLISFIQTTFSTGSNGAIR